MESRAGGRTTETGITQGGNICNDVPALLPFHEMGKPYNPSFESNAHSSDFPNKLVSGNHLLLLDYPHRLCQ